MTNTVNAEVIAVGAPLWLVALTMAGAVLMIMFIGYFAITFYRRNKPK